jgi:hypothetical protein
VNWHCCEGRSADVIDQGGCQKDVISTACNGLLAIPELKDPSPFWISCPPAFFILQPYKKTTRTEKCSTPEYPGKMILLCDRTCILDTHNAESRCLILLTFRK